ncbi:hypothetical protein RhiirA1_457829 [Rhizophagus irregularis]|uniref:Uncharacterized protein n=1 Tax=Rhizophagus irregularis TaxID=588596 RepID=A0A2N0RXB2_9GLOM|nr:hypothetical protein RhiirA1_457829 [Rhizophagus irregularis]
MKSYQAKNYCKKTMGEFLSEPIEDKNTTEGICCQQHDLIYVTSTIYEGEEYCSIGHEY